jgi:uncharacterized protein (TIGR02594 family)
MKLPIHYEWLNKEGAPKMLVEALKLFGIKEQPGDADNPEIINWAKETGLTRMYSTDSTPWCGLLMAVVARRADKSFPPNPLWARNWAQFGVPSSEPGLGDVLVFSRGNGGHVALYVGEDKKTFHVLGGNQSDAVTITRIEKSRLLAARRPIWKTEQPANVRKIELRTDGVISGNES